MKGATKKMRLLVTEVGCYSMISLDGNIQESESGRERRHMQGKYRGGNV